MAAPVVAGTVAAPFFFGIAGLLALISLILLIIVLVEILRAKNSSGYKILWVILSLFLGLLGILLYLLIGRKSLQGEKIGALKWLFIAAVVLFVLAMATMSMYITTGPAA